MGWSSGSRLFGDIIITTKNQVPDMEVRKQLYRGYIDSFQDFDWDTLDECLGEDPAYDAVFQEIYPDD